MKETYCWLENYFGYSKSFKTVLKDEMATSFLLVWPIFEQEMFKGFMKTQDIPTVANNLKVNYDQFDIDDTIEYFHNRYQDRSNKRNLVHSKSTSFFDDALNIEYQNLTDEQKLEIALFVVYRYRNNIFHGNKGIESWSKYSKEIKYCMKIMMNIIDHKSSKEKNNGNIKM